MGRNGTHWDGIGVGKVETWCNKKGWDLGAVAWRADLKAKQGGARLIFALP